MLLARLIGGCTADATTEGAPAAQGDNAAAAAPPAIGDGTNPSNETPSAPPAPPPGPGEEVPPAPATAGRIVGYAHIANAAAAQSTPSPFFSFNASGGAISITRAETGIYAVDFAGLALDKSVALVSGYATESRVCTWTSTSGSSVAIKCIDQTGAAADSKVVVTVVDEGQPSGASILGYAHAHDMNADSYTPQASRSNNGVGGGAITASRTAVGIYKVAFAGLLANDIENVQITPYGSGSARCVVQSWGLGAVFVRCFDQAGAPADSQYVVMIAGKNPGATARITAFAHAANALTPSYTPALAYHEADGVATAIRSDSGTYSMAFAGLDLNGSGHVQVTGQLQGRRCNVDAWAGTTTNVTCASSVGLKDGNYGIVVVQ
jgi:hypothetical protein